MGSAVPRKQSSLHDFGQVDEREYGLVEVREVASKDIFLVGRKLLDCVVVHDQFRWSEEYGRTSQFVNAIVGRSGALVAHPRHL